MDESLLYERAKAGAGDAGLVGREPSAISGLRIFDALSYDHLVRAI
jgi:hypothetical protein